MSLSVSVEFAIANHLLDLTQTIKLGRVRGQVSHQTRVKRGLFAIVLEYTRVVVRINL